MAEELDAGSVPGARLVALSSRNMERARKVAGGLSRPPKVLPLPEMVPLVDLVVEAAAGAALDVIAKETLGRGRDLLALSCGALLDRDDLFALARSKGATIFVPSGAIAGLDGVASATAGRIDSVTMITRKPPGALRGAPGVAMAGIGPDRTTIRIYADPNVTRNTHEIVVEGEFGRLAVNIENVPSPDNPRTGLLSALSAVSTLRKITSPVRIGT